MQQDDSPRAGFTSRIPTMSAVIATKIGPWAEVLELQDADATDLPTISTKPRSGMLLVRVVTCGLAFPDILVVEVCIQREIVH